ncbi:hypothetical protein VNO77_08289 [Canavalia gladiata]|uniref:Uncharacterized protein n=1 Tax=Canavalia gladiata TaxID=3824 RepID=A0AAN9MDV3_CANGL
MEALIEYSIRSFSQILFDLGSVLFVPIKTALQCRDVVSLDASLHSVMLQPWLLHTLDFLIFPSLIHVPLVIGMVLALVMFLAIKYSDQIGILHSNKHYTRGLDSHIFRLRWTLFSSERTVRCAMELHPANTIPRA